MFFDPNSFDDKPKENIIKRLRIPFLLILSLVIGFLIVINTQKEIPSIIKMDGKEVVIKKYKLDGVTIQIPKKWYTQKTPGQILTSDAKIMPNIEVKIKVYDPNSKDLLTITQKLKEEINGELLASTEHMVNNNIIYHDVFTTSDEGIVSLSRIKVNNKIIAFTTFYINYDYYNQHTNEILTMIASTF